MTPVTRPNVVCSGNRFEKRHRSWWAAAAAAVGELVGPPRPRSQTGHRAQLSSRLESGDDDEMITTPPEDLGMLMRK